jgi:hypothetical protein
MYTILLGVGESSTVVPAVKLKFGASAQMVKFPKPWTVKSVLHVQWEVGNYNI